MILVVVMTEVTPDVTVFGTAGTLITVGTGVMDTV